MVTLEINATPVRIESGSSILVAAEKAGIRIPTLCHIKGLFPTGACRLCVVEVEGKQGLVPSCSFPAENGMKVFTGTPRVLNARRTIVELLLASHPFECLTCNRNGSCELQQLAAEYQITQVRYHGRIRHHYIDFSSPSLVRNPDKCILCGRCVRICEEVQDVSAIDFTGRGFDTMVLPAFDSDLSETTCVNCGQCVVACPTGALQETSAVDTVVQMLLEGKKRLVAQVAPAIRVSLGEFYGMKPGANVTGRVATALRKIGFHHIFDTDVTADLTIMEEGTELVRRLTDGGPLPLLTSCCPGWVKFAEHNFPELLPNISTSKSPQQMMGTIVKTYFAEKQGIAPEELFVVSIMPCTAKKFEARRPEHSRDGVPDVDAVLTTRELARLIDLFGIDFASLPEGGFDSVLGETSGSGDIFAASGGVMESALRSAGMLLTGEEIENIEFTDFRGVEGLKEAVVTLGGKELRVAVVNTLKRARELVKQMQAGEARYDFVEVMACPGGCLGGGGQMYGFDSDRIRTRISAVYDLDRSRPVRRSYESSVVRQLYDDFLGKPGSPRAHELLHTTYAPRVSAVS